MAQETDPAPLDPDFGEHERLFHYTTSDGLKGILTSGCLWASHYQALNDPNEFHAAQKGLAEFMKKEVREELEDFHRRKSIPIPPGTTLEQVSNQDGATVVSLMYKVTLGMLSPYIFSAFCCAPDCDEYADGDLGHWRTYGRDRGYAIQINPHKLKVLIEREGARFNESRAVSSKVVYCRAGDLPSEWKTERDAVAKSARELIRAIIGKRDPDHTVVGESATPFLRIASCTKPAAFRAEREARIVVFRNHQGNIHNVRLRSNSNGHLGPYVSVFEDHLLAEDSPIDRIIVGPQPAQDRRKAALEVFLKARGLKVDVEASKIPYLPE